MANEQKIIMVHTLVHEYHGIIFCMKVYSFRWWCAKRFFGACAVAPLIALSTFSASQSSALGGESSFFSRTTHVPGVCA